MNEKVMKFLQENPLVDGITRRELSGGLGLSLTEVQTIVDALLASGDIIVLNSSDQASTRRYRMPFGPEPPAPIFEPYDNADLRINRAAAAIRQQERLEHPVPVPPQAHRVTDEEVAKALLAQEAARKNITFTPDERAFLDRTAKQLPGLNPNVALKR